MMEQFMPRLEEQPEVSRYFQEGMIALTRYVKDDIVKQVSLPPNARRLLDIGGGHAMYSIALCQQYPQLSAVVVDGAQPLIVGRESIAAAGMAGRITTQAGNFVTDDLGAGYDVALLFNIVHGFTPAGNLELFRKIKAALNPGGQLIVLEQLAGAVPLPLMDTVVQILSVSFFHALGGQVYTYQNISDWLREVGFSDIRCKNILKAGSALIRGVLSN